MLRMQMQSQNEEDHLTASEQGSEFSTKVCTRRAFEPQSWTEAHLLKCVDSMPQNTGDRGWGWFNRY